LVSFRRKATLVHCTLIGACFHPHTLVTDFSLGDPVLLPRSWWWYRSSCWGPTSDSKLATCLSLCDDSLRPSRLQHAVIDVLPRLFRVPGIGFRCLRNRRSPALGPLGYLLFWRTFFSSPESLFSQSLPPVCTLAFSGSFFSEQFPGFRTIRTLFTAF